MEAPKFIIGDEKRFDEFVKSLGSAEKIIAVSHTDLDGLASAKVIDYAIKADKVFMKDYHELNDDFINEIENEKPTHIVITDLLIRNPDFIKKLAGFSKVLMIDHHIPETDFNGENVFFLNAQGFCAAYLSHYLFSKIKDLSEIDWIVACASIADVQYRNNAEWMQEVFSKYGFKFDIENLKEGSIWNLTCALSNSLVYYSNDRLEVYRQLGNDFGDIGNLQKYGDEVQREIDNCLLRFEKERMEIYEGYFWEFSSKFPVKSIVSTILGFRYPAKTILIAEKRDKYYLSGRRQNKDKVIKMNEMLQKLTSGFEDSDAGGHIPAAGGHIQIKDAEEFKKRLNKLEDYI